MALMGTQGGTVRSGLEPELNYQVKSVRTVGPNSVRVVADKYGPVGLSGPALMMIGELFLLAGATHRDKGRSLTVADACVSGPQLLAVGHRL